MTDNNDIMRHILDAAQSVTSGNTEEAKESLRDAIELIDIQLFDIEEE